MQINYFLKMNAMAVSKDWCVRMVLRSAGWFIVVCGQANASLPALIPELKKRNREEEDRNVLKLDLVHTDDVSSETYQEVQYLRKVDAGKYRTVDIYWKDMLIQSIAV